MVRRLTFAFIAWVGVAAVTVPVAVPAPLPTVLPARPDSLKFAAIGDSGTGDRPQYDVGQRMATERMRFPFELVIMLGDNMYGRQQPEDFVTKFERPYAALLSAGVVFYASLGNHDNPRNAQYEPFHMGGERYYTFTPETPLLAGLTGTSVQFFMIDTEYLDNAQLAWLEREMTRSKARWKIPVFHRPIYTSGRYSSPARIFRGALEPIFLRHGVRVAFSGHEHFYERTVPQRGITYFISGAAGSLRLNDIGRSPVTARGFDTDYSFMLVEVAGDELHFQSISRAGHSVDAGAITVDTDPHR